MLLIANIFLKNLSAEAFTIYSFKSELASTLFDDSLG
jgi:hypothetical protein